MAVKSEKAEFPGAHGDLLAARLEVPDGPVRAWALFAHCFTCSKDVFAAKRISRGLAERGIAVLRFDFTGLGNSEGDFANTNFSSNVEDLVAAAEWLAGNHGGPDLLVGHSLGGAAVLAAALRLDGVKAVATIGAPADPGHVEHLIADAETIERDGEAEVQIAGRSFRITRQFLQDIRGQSLREGLGRMRKALLVCHAPGDQTVSIDNASAIFGAARHPKSFLSLDRADHLLTDREDAVYVAEVLAAWASRFLEKAAASDSGADRSPIAPDGGWAVFETGKGRYAHLATDGRHVVPADEPTSFGGDDTGPGPYDLLCIALGACTSMTMRMYAERKGWPVERIAVRVRQSKIHAEDCADCEVKEGKVDRFEREIHLAGPLDDDQRARLLEIADKCPVHQTLHRRNDIVTRTVDG